MAQRSRRFLYNNAPLLTVMAIFVGAYLIAGQVYPAMQKPQVFFNLFINNASLLIVSIGMTLVILTKGIDLSVAAVIALTSVASAALLRNNVSPMVVMPSMLVMGTLFGFTLGCIIHYLKVQPFIVTLMGAYFARGMAYIIDLNAVPIENEFYKALGLTPIVIPFLPKSYVYVYALVGPILLVVAVYLSYFTRFGRTIYAIGNNEQSAVLMGLPAGAHQDRRLRLQRVLCFAGGHRVERVSAVRLWAVCAFDGAGRHRRGRDRRHPADGRCRQRDRHPVWRADYRHDHLDPPV